MRPNYIVIHSMAKELLIDGKLIPAKEFLTSIGLSAHMFIASDWHQAGHKEFDEVAFHAGHSEWNNDTNLNRCSVGIELLIDGVNNYNDFVNAIKLPSSFTDGHYSQCAIACAKICKEFQLIPQQAIVLHNWISGDHVRGEGNGKVDPGAGFDWQRLVSMTDAELLRL